MPTPQSCVEALLIESGFSLPYAFRDKKPGFFASDPPPPARRSRTIFYVRWHHTLKSVMLIQGGRGGPSPKVRVFCNSGWPDSGKFCGSIACPYSTSHTHTPKKQKNNNKRCSDLDYNQSHAPSQILECSEGKGAPWGMVLVANPAEGCHHMRLLEPRVNAVRQILHSGMPD